MILKIGYTHLMKLNYSVIILLLTMLTFNQSQAAAKEINPSCNMCNIGAPVPDIIAGKMSPALNGMGYIFYHNTPIVEDFIKNEAHSNKTLIEIGAGFSNITIDALKNGVGSYTANDISEEHLKILVSRIKQALGDEAGEKIKNLRLLRAKAPNELPEVHQYYDAILADKVMQYMSPDEIIRFIQWSKSALKKGGKIYVITASPYFMSYRQLFPEYLARIALGKKFPGYFKNINQTIDHSTMKIYPNYQIPNEVVLFSRAELVKLFQEQGMEVIQSHSYKIPDLNENAWQPVDDRDATVSSLIAVNP